VSGHSNERKHFSVAESSEKSELEWELSKGILKAALICRLLLVIMSVGCDALFSNAERQIADCCLFNHHLALATATLSNPERPPIGLASCGTERHESP
jgi:hypothetical protein